MHFSKYNQDYEMIADKDLVSDKDFTIPDPPAKITQEWLDIIKAKVRIRQEIDAKIFLANQRSKI